jgi:hypothetical protein
MSDVSGSANPPPPPKLKESRPKSSIAQIVQATATTFALVLAAVTFSVYVIPKEQLSKANEDLRITSEARDKAIADEQKAESDFTQTKAANEKLAADNKAFAGSFAAATQRFSDLTQKADTLQEKASGLRKETDRLAQQNAKAERDLTEAQSTTHRLVDASAAFLHANRYRQFVDQIGRTESVLFPTTETVPEQAAVNITCFTIVDRQKMQVTDKDTAEVNGYVIDNYVVLGMESEVQTPGGDSFHMHAKLLSRDDPRFQKFITLLNSRPAIDLMSFMSLRFSQKIPEGKKLRVFDLLTEHFAGKPLFSLGFIPGKIGDASFEDFSIRSFWITGVSDSLSRMSNASGALKGKLETLDGSKIDLSTGITFDVNQREWKGISKQISDMFGSNELPYLQKRLGHLDDAWVQQLSAGDLEFRPGEPLRLSADKHASMVFHRWDWNALPEEISVTLFDTLVEKERTDFTLACAAAQFLEKNQLPAGPEVLATLSTCRSVGVSGVTGARIMTVLKFVMPHGEAFPFPCSDIDGVVTAPGNFRYEFHSHEYPVGPPHSLCAEHVLVPEGEPISISAYAPDYVGQPAASAPQWDRHPGSSEIGWKNPAVFLATEHGPAAYDRLIQMQPQSEGMTNKPKQ